MARSSFKIFSCFFIFLPINLINSIEMSHKKFRCLNGQCHPLHLSEKTSGIGLEICQLQCGRYGPLWPRPTGTINLGTWTTAIDAQRISIKSVPFVETSSLFTSMFAVFQDRLKGKFALAQPNIRGGSVVLL